MYKKLFLLPLVVALLFLFVGSSSFAGRIDGLLKAMEAIGFAPVIETGQTIPYALGDDGDLEMGITWPEPRFINNEDGTVTDNLTGLIWTRNANLYEGTDWSQALSNCSDCNVGDYNDWRMPNVKELQSLIDYGEESSALPADHPFDNVQTESDEFEDGYWSSTTYAHLSDDAWSVYFDTGIVDGDVKSSKHHVWPVRGGQ